MKKCIIIPDSFKGTLSSIEVCSIMKKSVLDLYKDCEVITIPVADGGEGTVDSILYATNGNKIEVSSTGPLNEPINTYYGVTNNTAIIEMASVAGITLIENKLNPYVATTKGLAVLIKDAISRGYKKIILGLGGSATNDCGVGMALGLGTKFYNSNNIEFEPTPITLKDVFRIDNTIVDSLLDGIEITAMCDIENPLCGPHGAAYIFAPQKGANEEMVKILDDNLEKLAHTIKDSLHKDVKNVKGAGAAGGLGAGVIAFLNGKLESGINTVLNLVNFNDIIKGADMIFTGEGKIDSQSLDGKVISGIASRAKLKNIPVTVVCGAIGDITDKVYDIGVSAIFSINTSAMDFSKSRYISDKNLEITMKNILRFQKTIIGEKI